MVNNGIYNYQKLLELKTNNGLSIEQLSENIFNKTGKRITTSTLWRHMTTKGNPRLESIKSIADYFEKPIEYFYKNKNKEIQENININIKNKNGLEINCLIPNSMDYKKIFRELHDIFDI